MCIRLAVIIIACMLVLSREFVGVSSDEIEAAKVPSTSKFKAAPFVTEGVSGYYSLSSFSGTSCDSIDYTHTTGYKSSTCLPSSGGSYMIVLASKTSCSGSYVMFYSDNYCQIPSYTSEISDLCYEGTLYHCSADVYAPSDSFYQEYFIAASNEPACSNSPDLYYAYRLDQCSAGSQNYKYNCTDTSIVQVCYLDDQCQDYDNDQALYPVNQCVSSSYNTYHASMRYTCHYPYIYDTDTSGSTDKQLHKVDQLYWVFIIVGFLLLLLLAGLIYRWWIRCTNVPKSDEMEVKMVTFFPIPVQSRTAVKYAAAPSELRI